MSTPTRLLLLTVAAFVLLLAPTLGKPGLPSGLKADEPAYYLMAASLAHDFDLELDAPDTERLFNEFPFRPARNLIVMSRDGWRHVYYAKPFVYSLAAAPFVRLFGANGMILLNALLLMTMILLASRHLARFNSSELAAFFACCFFFLGVTWNYVFWLQPEVFNMFGVAAFLHLGLRRHLPQGTERTALRLVIAGAVFAPAVFNKPMLLALLLPVVCIVRSDSRSWIRSSVRQATAVGAGLLLSLAAICLFSFMMTGEPSPYFARPRLGVDLCAPGQMPNFPASATSLEASAGDPADGSSADPRANTEQTEVLSADDAIAQTGSPTGNSWSWIFSLPEVPAGKVVANLGWFLWGRHTGLLVYMPFAALATVLFLIGGPRQPLERWLLLLAIATVVAFLVVRIHWNWQGGGGFVGNRYFVMMAPAFVYLVTTIRPAWLIVASAAIAGLFIGPLLVAPFGLQVPEPTLQAHTRNTPLRLLPYEHGLRNVPGYFRVPLAGIGRLTARADQFLPRGDGGWFQGGNHIRAWITSAEPIVSTSIWIKAFRADTRLELHFGHQTESMMLGEGEVRLVNISPGGAPRSYGPSGERFFVYPLEVTTDRGAVLPWTRESPPSICRSFPANTATTETFFTGAEVLWIGDNDPKADVYHVEWDQPQAPALVPPGARFPVEVSLTNRSGVAWTPQGAARVRLSYHWYDATGTQAVFDGDRTELPTEVGPDQRITTVVQVIAPKIPGSYELELDLVYELIGWFSQKGAPTVRMPVLVGSPGSQSVAENTK